MKCLSVSVISVILMLVPAGSAFGEREDFTSIELTEDQIAIIVHNFPQVEIEELTVGRDHISDDNVVELAPAGRSGVAPVDSR
ncbi:MAG: hypothetical protein KAS73_02755 [Candidatus Sabulitectum sp.]|nr:hypothetical protein [Candidatus Sabulitectum sp.]